MEKLTQIQSNEEIHKFLILFLNDDEDLSVHMEEMDKIDFSGIVKHIDAGGSVFITRRRKPQAYPEISEQLDNPFIKPYFFREI